MPKDDKKEVKKPVKKLVKKVKDDLEDDEIEIKEDVKKPVKKVIKKVKDDSEDDEIEIKEDVKKPVKKVIKKVKDDSEDDEIEIKEDVKKPVKKPVKKIVKKVDDSDDDEDDNDDDNITYLKPILKWVGGKTQIIDDIIESFPDKMDNYHELFTGGGSVLIALLQNVNEKKIIVKNKIYAYDINETLINIYKNIQKKPDEVIKNIKKLINEYNSIPYIKKDTKSKQKRKSTITPENIEEAKKSQESYYYWIRSVFNKMTPQEKNDSNGSAHFIFLNKTCFRGVYREGPNGFNVPYGNYKSPEIINEDHVNKISELIKNVEFIKSDFEDSFKNINKHDFIYADPPYVPESATSFVGYTSCGFNLDKHKKLFDELCKKHNFVMSNSDTDLVKKSFADKKKYSIEIISCKRSINSKKPGSKTNEVIIKSL